MLSIPQIILRAEISQYLAVNAIQRGGLFGGGIPSHLPELLYMVRKSVARMYNLDPTEANLIGNANYLYTLCGKFGIYASYLISSGGAIPSPSGTTRYSYPYSSQYVGVSDGETSLELRDTTGNILPIGTIITWVSKSTTPLPEQTIQYRYEHPNLVLLNGISMGIGEILSFQYVVPL